MNKEYPNISVNYLEEKNHLDIQTIKRNANRGLKEPFLLPITIKSILLFMVILSIIGCTSLELIDNESKNIDDMLPTVSFSKTSTATQTLTETMTPTVTPTVTPTAMSGGYPLLAYLLRSDEIGENYLRIVNLQLGITLAEIPLISAAYKITFSDDGRILAYAVYEKTETRGHYVIQLYHLDTGVIEKGPTLKEGDELEALSISPNNEWVMYQFWDNPNRHPRIYLFNLLSKKSTFVDRGVSNGAWTENNVLIYQKYFGPNHKYDPVTNQSYSIRLPSQSKLYGSSFSSTLFRYVPELDSVLLIGSNRVDNSTHFVLVSLETKEEYYLAHIGDDNEKFQDINRILFSPNGEYLIIESRHKEPYENTEILRDVYTTYFAKKDDLPLTGDERPLDIYPIGWSPDSRAFIAYQPRSGNNANAVIFDAESLTELSNYAFVEDELENLWFYGLIAEYFGVGYFWDDSLLSFDVRPHQSSTPSPTLTLAPDITPSPTPSPLYPLNEMLSNANQIGEADFSLMDDEGWDYDHVEIHDDEVVVIGTGDWESHLIVPFEINVNNGVLVKFQSRQKSLGVILISRGIRSHPSYRLWAIQLNNKDPYYRKGESNSGFPEIINEIEATSDKWNYVFLGIDDQNNLIQILWDPDRPLDYQVSLHDFGDKNNEPYFFQVLTNIGEIRIGEVIFYSFDGYLE